MGDIQLTDPLMLAQPSYPPDESPNPADPAVQAAQADVEASLSKTQTCLYNLLIKTYTNFYYLDCSAILVDMIIYGTVLFRLIYFAYNPDREALTNTLCEGMRNRIATSTQNGTTGSATRCHCTHLLHDNEPYSDTEFGDQMYTQ